MTFGYSFYLYDYGYMTFTTIVVFVSYYNYFKKAIIIQLVLIKNQMIYIIITSNIINQLYTL